MPLKLEGVHILLTYRCNRECEHCFTWGSPDQNGTMTLQQIRRLLHQARDVGSVEWVYFEGGEPFLCYPELSEGVRDASRLGFKVGIVSNAFWAKELNDAIDLLRPFVDRVQDLSISSDTYHGSREPSPEAVNALEAGRRLGIPVELISITAPGATDARSTTGQLPTGESSVMYRGRAAHMLAHGVHRIPWVNFRECPFEDLRAPERVHVDPFGNVHICQGISLGNVFQTPLSEICDQYDPQTHPIIAALLRGGPSELVRGFGLSHEEMYADACHLCYESRRALRDRFPEHLCPDQSYGVPGGSSSG